MSHSDLFHAEEEEYPSQCGGGVAYLTRNNLTSQRLVYGEGQEPGDPLPPGTAVGESTEPKDNEELSDQADNDKAVNI